MRILQTSCNMSLVTLSFALTVYRYPNQHASHLHYLAVKLILEGFMGIIKQISGVAADISIRQVFPPLAGRNIRLETL